MGCGREELKRSRRTGPSWDFSADLLGKKNVKLGKMPLRAPTFPPHILLHTAQEIVTVSPPLSYPKNPFVGLETLILLAQGLVMATCSKLLSVGSCIQHFISSLKGREGLF